MQNYWASIFKVNGKSLPGPLIYDVTRDLPLTWYMVHQTEGSVMEITGMLVGLGFIFVRTRRVAGEASRAETHKSAAKSQGALGLSSRAARALLPTNGEFASI